MEHAQQKPAAMTPRLDIEKSDASIVNLGRVGREALADLNEAIRQDKITFERHECPVCSGDRFQTVATRDRYGVPCDTVICSGCGLLQTNPYLDSESLDWFYENIFTRLHRGTEKPTDERFVARRKKAAEVVEWIRRAGGPSDGIAVDVGCGSGGFLQGMQDAGYTGIGVEIDRQYSQWGRERGLDIRTGTLEQPDIPDNLDLVTYIQVLEHIVDLESELEQLSAKLKPDGMVFIEVPGPTSVEHMYNHDFLRLLQLAHIWHFTPESLTNLMRLHGFEPVHVDGFVRGLFRKSQEAKAVSPASGEDHAEKMQAFIRKSERRRLLHWRTWAIKAKAALRSN